MEPSGGQAAHRSHQAVPADPGVRTEGAGGANEFFRVAPLEVRLSCSESEAAKEALEADDQADGRATVLTLCQGRPPVPQPDPDRTSTLPGYPRAVSDAVLKAMEQNPIFEGCAPELLEVLLRESKRKRLAPGEVLKLTDCGPLYLVETGAVRFQVGDEKQTSIQGRGLFVNGTGFLRLLAEAKVFKQRLGASGVALRPKAARQQGYDVHGYGGLPPAIYLDFRGPPQQPEEYSGPDDVTMAFFNTCPYSCRMSSDPPIVQGWLSLTVSGAAAGEQPAKAGAALPGGGATVCGSGPLQKIQDMLDRKMGEAEVTLKMLGNFGLNCLLADESPYELMSRFIMTVFPGAPFEAVYMLAESGKRCQVPKGSNVVVEGETGEDADALVLIVNGVASVLKKVQEVDGTAEQQVRDYARFLFQEGPWLVFVFFHNLAEVVGRLRAGAIIGDVSLIGALVPRPATVRAKTDVEAVVLPGRAILNVLAVFPALLHPATDRLVDVAECIKERLLTKTEVASSLNLFFGCDLGFVNDVASSGERRLLFAGETVVQQGGTEGTLFVLEHGRVSIQVAGLGAVNEVPAGNCFGERTLLGIAKEANATVRVFTPFALVLAIGRPSLHKALKKHPVETEHFEKLKTSPQGGRISGSKVRHVELFRACGTGFLEALNARVTSAMYLHGQTIVVEGCIEQDPCMFVLSGGIVVAERGGCAIARISPGATFGELAMLGQSPERAVTIRAVTLCFLMSIQSSVFHQALEQFPEEKERFSNDSLEGQKEGPRVVWPCLRGESSRLLYLLDLYAEKLSCEMGDRRLGQAPLNEAAILILDGEVSVLTREGEELQVLTAGCCWNERVLIPSHWKFCVFLRSLYVLCVLAQVRPARVQILAGARAKQTERLVRIVTRETWGKVMAEFPSDLGKVRGSILRYMGEQAEKRLGYPPGSPALLQEKTAFFSAVSPEFARLAREMAETRIVEPGCDIVPESLVNEVVACRHPEEESAASTPSRSLRLEKFQLLEEVREGEDDDEEEEMYVFLHGSAICYSSLTGERSWRHGEVIGEGAFAGATRLYPARIVAESVCLIQVLRRKEIFEAMAEREGRDKELDRLVKEVWAQRGLGDCWMSWCQYDTPVSNSAQPYGMTQLRKRLQRSWSFRNAQPGFANSLVTLPDVVLFPPNHLITEQGDECKLGQSDMFLVLAGRVRVEGAVGTHFSTVGAGQVFGEVGAFGLSKRRTASARTWEEGLVCCLRFRGSVVKAAAFAFPLDKDKLATIWKRTELKNRSTELERREWIKATAIPALAQTPLLGGCPPSFFHSLAVLLKEQTYKPESCIVKCGEKLESMMIFIQGAAQMKTRVGDEIGLMRKGSIFGEANGLGLFQSSMATVQVLQERCRLLLLPHVAMSQALAGVAAKSEGITDAFQKLVTGRREQVERGVPLCAMNILAQKNDVRVRAIALVAERADLETGEEWQPIADSEPSGPFFGVLASGRVMVEIGPDRHIVLQLTAGSIFPEGLLATYGAVCRAETYCEAYRVRWHDFYMAVGLSTPAPNDWFWKFRVQEKATVERLTRRLQSVQGLLDVNLPHAKDDEIKAWKDQRGQRLSQAKKNDVDFEALSRAPLPLLGKVPGSGPETRFNDSKGSDVSLSLHLQSSALRPRSPWSSSPGPCCPAISHASACQDA
ncbi:SKOR [Symbiodinium natans]|uniref:SKOR protein n=1 Tax=Symbiodinium natans TaxID=878477 RepID=A0A812J4D0_9DINO|nr:SKOR [Symbiodinium natans]